MSRPPTDVTIDEGRRGQDGGIDLSALLPRFTIKGTLGEGGMGVVIEAFDKLLSREVAIKLLRKHTDPTVGERFLREARAAAKLRDDGIVSVHDIDPDGGYIVMELVRGESLSARLHREGKLPVDELRRIGHKFLNALGTAHAAGIIHRDVKPHNVLLGEKGEVKLADFGVAYFGDSELTSPEVRVGTPMYMAPEQLRAREVDARADVYAAGATLFEAATGKRLNADDTPKDPVALVLAATGDRALALAIGRATRERASERFANGREFAEALDATAASLPAPARGRRVALVLVLAVLIGGGAGGFAFYRARVAKKAHGHHAVALLPFIDATHAQQLDFASAGLPNLLGLELHGMPDVKVIGYYQLLSNVRAADSPPAEWVAAAKKLGADVLVHGELAPDANGVRVRIRVEEADGQELATVERSGHVEQVPEIVRGSAPQVARAVAGRDLGGAAHASTFAADRELQLGIAELEREHLDEAADHFSGAIREAPGLAAAHYYMAITQSWKAPPADPALAEIDKAIALGVDDTQRGLLEGVRGLVKQDYQQCIDTLRPLAEKYPDDREILYVLFEALYHGGRPAESMAVFRRIVALEPRFRLGLVHAFTFYIARADDAGMTWALQLADPAGDAYNRVWEPRVLMARREYAAAIRLLSRLIDESTNSAGDLQTELAYAYVLNGQPELATAIVHKLTEGSSAGSEVTLMSLAMMRGDAAERKRWFGAALRHYDMLPMGPSRNVGFQLIEVPALFVADKTELADISQRLEESIIQDYGRALNLGIAQALLAEQLADKARLDKLAQSPYPEVADTAKAALARAAGDRRAAAEAMRGAIAATGDARFLINLQFLLAGDLRALGDQAGMAAACDEVIRPRLFSWAWVATAPTCKQWVAGSRGETPPTR